MRIPYASPSHNRPFLELGPDNSAVVLRTLEAGWQVAQRSETFSIEAGEVEITERLRDGMRQALSEGELPWGKQLIVAPGTESRSQPDILVPDGRTDIPVYFIEIFTRYGEHDPHAIVECKRISGSDTHLCREYVVEGVDRFKTGKYSLNHSAGYMAGYVRDGTAAEAADGVNAYLNRTGRIDDSLSTSPILSGPFWSSSHLRPEPNQPIELHHALLSGAAE